MLNMMKREISMNKDLFTWIRDISLQSEALQPFQNRATEHSFTSGCEFEYFMQGCRSKLVIPTREIMKIDWMIGPFEWDI